MAKASINTDAAAQPVHTRTTTDTVESQVVVIGIDGSDDVVGADTANGLDVDVTRLPALAAGTNNIGEVTGPAATETTGTVAGVGQVVAQTLPAGVQSVSIFITGTFAGASVIAFEKSYDGGTTYDTCAMSPPQTSPLPVTTMTGNDFAFGVKSLSGDVANATHFRVRQTTFTAADSINIRVRSSQYGSIIVPGAYFPVVGGTGPGSAHGSQAPVSVAGSDGTLVRRLLTDTSGRAEVRQQPASLIVTNTAATGAAVTATLAAPGAGLFHYITRINILKYATAAVTGIATPVLVTSTNIPGPVAWTTPTAQAIGTVYETDVESSSSIKSTTANTATTIVAPVQTGVIWRITVYYYTGS